jgi:membrane-anchored mycosin MYCP
MRRKAGDIATLARAVVHLANLGVKVMNISVTACINAAQPIDQAALVPRPLRRGGQGHRHRGGRRKRGRESSCAQNPVFNPLRPDDPATGRTCPPSSRPPGSRLRLTVGAVAPDGQPLPQSIAGPWVGVAAPAEIMGLSSVNGAPINALPGREPGKATPLSAPASPPPTPQGGRPGAGEVSELSAPDHSADHRNRAQPAARCRQQGGLRRRRPVAALTFDVAPGDRLPPSI